MGHMGVNPRKFRIIDAICRWREGAEEG